MKDLILSVKVTLMTAFANHMSKTNHVYIDKDGGYWDGHCFVWTEGINFTSVPMHIRVGVNGMFKLARLMGQHSIPMSRPEREAWTNYRFNRYYAAHVDEAYAYNLKMDIIKELAEGIYESGWEMRDEAENEYEIKESSRRRMVGDFLHEFVDIMTGRAERDEKAREEQDGGDEGIHEDHVTHDAREAAKRIKEAGDGAVDALLG
jgi:hypothetical protein